MTYRSQHGAPKKNLLCSIVYVGKMLEMTNGLMQEFYDGEWKQFCYIWKKDCEDC